jgi:hypothetical protein
MAQKSEYFFIFYKLFNIKAKLYFRFYMIYNKVIFCFKFRYSIFNNSINQKIIYYRAIINSFEAITSPFGSITNK